MADELKITASAVFDYGRCLKVRLSDGRTLDLDVAHLEEMALSADQRRIVSLERDRDELLMQRAAANG